jgi:hypothetical protein
MYLHTHIFVQEQRCVFFDIMVAPHKIAITGNDGNAEQTLEAVSAKIHSDIYIYRYLC